MNLTNKQKGLGLSLIGVLLITPDSLFLRLIDLGAWELVFYRGLVPFICLLIVLSFYYRSQFIKSFLVLGIPGLIYAILIALGSTTFVISIENTYVANTLIMIALLPFATAILSSIFLKEHPSKRMWLTIIACFAVVLFIFYDSYQGNRLYGDFFGLLTAIMVGGSAVVVRYGKNFNFLPALLLSKFFIMLIAIIFMQNFPETLFVDQKNLYLIIAMGVFAVFIPLAMITLAPRYITAAEVNLFFLLETVLGPFWVWLVIKEQPSLETIIGGAIIILTIAIHSFIALKKT